MCSVLSPLTVIAHAGNVPHIQHEINRWQVLCNKGEHSFVTTLRRIGIPGTSTASWGEHLCAFFYTKAHLLDLLVPYIKTGLEDNEYCLWITGESVTKEEALHALEGIMPDAATYLASNQLAIISYREWYFSSGVFNPQKSFDNWAARAQCAKANGFSGTRTTGNPFWLQSEEDWTRFLDYEHIVNRAIETQRVISLCTYPVDICNSKNMLSTLASHHAMLLSHGDEWKCLDLRGRGAMTQADHRN